MPETPGLWQARLLAFCLALVLAGAATLFLPARQAHATVAMPYSDEGLSRLNEAREKIRPLREADVDSDIRVKQYIETQRQVFASAGYDYDRSMIRIINDIQFDRYVVNKATITLNALARELLRIHVKTDTNPTKYLGRAFGVLLIDFRALIRSNMKKYGGC